VNGASLLVEDVHTYYGESYVLQGVSMALDKGGLVAILGRNGVGKTTLIRTIVAFTPPRRGRVVFDGIEVTRWPAHRIAQSGVGLVPQGRRIFPSLSVRETLVIAERGAARVERNWSFDAVLELFPWLRERLGNRAGTLSGGEQQMLAVARALIGNPRLLLMDEPTEGLSPFIVEDLKTLLVRLKATGMTMLLVEQNLAFALQLADYAYVMDKGRIVYHATPAALEANTDIMSTYLGL
jgi:branched-chain amino acid transport system ATP-binding protein